jgi:hypothetical protein
VNGPAFDDARSAKAFAHQRMAIGWIERQAVGGDFARAVLISTVHAGGIGERDDLPER